MRYKPIIKMNLDLLASIVEIIYPIKYAINLNEYSDIGTHWIALYVNNKTVAYFDSFGIEHIPKEVKTFIVIEI